MLKLQAIWTAFFIFTGGYIQAQDITWQEFESIGYSRYSHPLVNVMIDGKQYYYHLDSQIMMDEMDQRVIGMTIGVKDGAYGVVRDDGALIVPFAYDGIRIEDDYSGQWYEGISYHYKFIILQENGLYGVADSNGHILSEPKYEKLKVINKNIIAVVQNNRWGWLDAQTGVLLQHPVFDDVRKTYVYDSYVQVEQDGRYGLAKKDGTIAIPIASERSLYFLRYGTSSYIVTKEQEVYTLSDSLGTVLLQGDYPELRSLKNSTLFTFTKSKKVGLIDMKSGKVVLEPELSTVLTCVRGLCTVMKEGKYGVINEQGKWVLSPADRVEFVNALGQGVQEPMIMEPDFEVQSDYSSSPQQVARKQYEAKVDSFPYFIRVYNDKVVSIYDWDGKRLVSASSDAHVNIIPRFYDGRTYFMTTHHDDQWSIRDESGKTILSVAFPYRSHYQYAHKAIEVRYDLLNRYVDVYEGQDDALYMGRVGLFDLKTQTMVIPPAPQSIAWLTEDYFKVITSSKEGVRVRLYNASAKPILEFDEDVNDVLLLDNGMLLAEKRKEYGNSVFVLMDTTGKVIYENPEWNSRGNFGHIRFPENDEWAVRDFHGGWKKMFTSENNLFINKEGEEKRFSAYDQVDSFFEGNAFVAKEIATEEDEDSFHFGGSAYHFGLIDSAGNEISPTVWQSVQLHSKRSGLIKVEQNGKYGLIDRRGKMILKPVYDYIESSNSALYLQIKEDEKLGLISQEGKVVLEPRYDFIRKNHNGIEKTWPLLVKEGEWHYFVGRDGKRYPIRSKEYTY